MDGHFVGLSVVDEVQDGLFFIRVAALVVDEIDRCAVAVAYGERGPVGGHTRVDGEGFALFVDAE